MTTTETSSSSESSLDEFLEGLYAAADWDLIPDYMIQSVKDWIEHGWPPSDFLQTVLAHDLWGAIMADEDVNEKELANWVRFLSKYVPRPCHGSYEATRDWAARGGYRGRKP